MLLPSGGSSIPGVAYLAALLLGAKVSPVEIYILLSVEPEQVFSFGSCEKLDFILSDLLL